MLEKYNELLEMLSKKYNVSAFCELETEYSAYITSNNKYIVSIYPEDNYLEIFIAEVDSDDTVESRNYKNVKYAYNFIKRYLEE